MRRRHFGRVIKRGQTYSIRYRKDGIEVQRTIGPDRALAVSVLADLEAKIAKEENLGIRVIADATLEEVAGTVRLARRARLSPRALVVQDQHLREAIGFFGERPVSKIAARDIEDFLNALAGKGLKASTRNRYWNSLSSLWREAVSRGFAAENVVRKVKRHREEARERPFLGEADLRKLLAACPPGLREIVAVLADTGLRRGELLSLCWSDVDLARGAVLVRRAKGGKGREVPLTTRAREAFDGIRARRGAIPFRGEDPVFGDLLARTRRTEKPLVGKAPLGDRERAETLLSKRFARLARRVGLPGTRLHDLRHSCASRLVLAGVPLSAVARVTGHSTLRCAALYGAHAPQDAAKMAIRALEAAGAVPAAEAPNPSQELGAAAVG